MANKEQVVAFLGPKATYTHQATLNCFPESRYNIVPHTDIKDVFVAVQDGTAAYGVVPFENSSNGPVIATLDLFANARDRCPDIFVCGETSLPVNHCLLGYIKESNVSSSSSGQRPEQARVSPKHDLQHITKVYSHEQALGQCKGFLSAYLKGADRLEQSSTSKAAEFVAQDSTGTSAAISSRLAADLYGLDVLAEGIQDSEGNTTRFLIIRRQQDGTRDDSEGDYKTLVSFTVEYGEPGALADCLAVFKKHQLNLTSIKQHKVWFFVEVIGMKRSDGQGGAVNDALQELDNAAKSWRWLGSWRNDLLKR